MKLLTSSSDSQYLSSMKHLLDENGIPAFVSNEDTNRMIPIGIAKASLWVYIDEQYDEAMMLLKDPDYEVINKVDMETFHELENSMEDSKTSLVGALRDLLIRGVVLLMAMFLFTFPSTPLPRTPPSALVSAMPTKPQMQHPTDPA